MNVDTGEIRKMTLEELDAMMADERPKWKPVLPVEASMLGIISAPHRPAALQQMRERRPAREKYPGQHTAHLQGAWQGS